MICTDLHVHSTASKRPSEWFLKKVGARESYTDIDTLYAKAKAQGMKYVTVTDHNTIEGALELIAKYPDDTFMSVEATTYFPENKCKIHLLVYDITQAQFEKINTLRQNIYALRRYLNSESLAHSVAHATYSVNKKIDMATLEKLILMFDVFEGLNGARNRLYNETWQKVLMNLTPETIETLIQNHGIIPLTQDPWNKGLTGGSDDHAGLFIGQTVTTSPDGESKEALINNIRTKKTNCAGRCNDYKSFAFSIYKIFCDYSNNRNTHSTSTIREVINTLLFTENRDSSFKNWLTRYRIKRGKDAKDKLILRFFDDIQGWREDEKQMDIEERMKRIYKSMATLLDGYVRMVCESLIKDIGNGDAGRVFKNLASSLPVMFISLPFFSSLKHLFLDRDLIGQLKDQYIPRSEKEHKRLLWFTDTFDDLNGVAINLRNYMRSAHERNLPIQFAVSIPEKNAHTLLPNAINLPEVFSHTPDFYDVYTLRIPSILHSVEMIYRYEPEKIIISTPGPVGLLGLLMSRLMGIPCTAIYHTDFAYQAEYIFNDEAVASLINKYIRWFYSCTDTIRVPTRQYIHILESQGYEFEKMSVLKRGFEIHPPIFSDRDKIDFLEREKIPDGYTLMYAGRISKDKRIHILADIYQRVAGSHPETNLVICGDGPDLEDLKALLAPYDRVFFTGRIPSDRLMDFYTCADLFLFPSTTDTFGMVIVEAQACGLPVLVTDVGGPQEIIAHGETGFVIPWDNMEMWVKRVRQFIDLKATHPDQAEAFSDRARAYVRENFSWDAALEDILSDAPTAMKQGVNSLLDDGVDPLFGEAISGDNHGISDHQGWGMPADLAIYPDGSINGDSTFENEYLENFELTLLPDLMHSTLYIQSDKTLSLCSPKKLKKKANSKASDQHVHIQNAVHA